MVTKRGKEPDMSHDPASGLPTYELELRAAEQRKRLHESVEELKSRVRENLDLKKAARAHIAPVSAGAALVSFVVGYAVAGIFTRH
jgi:hypothetical protein